MSCLLRSFSGLEVRSRVGETLELISACAGWSKESLDEVDLMLQIQSVVSLFGPYIRYRVKSNEEISLVASASGNATNGASPFQSYHGYIPPQRKEEITKILYIIMLFIAFMTVSCSGQAISPPS